jgi:GntR family transcriptional regulator/MocR family aminotransferase
MEDGELQRHFWRMRRVYHARRDHFVAALEAQLGQWLEARVPPGGMAIWARVAKSLPVGAFLDESARRGVLFQPGKLFTSGGRDSQHVRLGFGALTEKELTTAVSRLGAAARAVVLR